MTISPRPFLLGNLPVLDVRDDLPHDYGGRSLGAITQFLIHHSASPTLPPSASVEQELAAIEQIQAMHRNPDWPSPGDGGPGIAYNLVLFQSLRCYYTGDLATVRWHSGGNNNLTGMALLYQGDYRNTAPPEPMIDQGVIVLNECRLVLNNAGIPTNGHQDVSPTACPGAWWPANKPRYQPGAPAPTTPPGAPVDPIRVQLDALWGLAEQVGGELEWRIKDATIALKDAIGLD